MKKNLLLLATAAVAISCAESGIEESAIGAVKGTTISVNVALPGDDNATRIAISEDTESGDWITSWVDTDCLGGWSNETYTFAKFEMVGTTDGTTATFEGLVSANDLRLVYPYDDTEESVYSYYQIDIAKQDVAIGSFDHMSAYTYMVSESYIEDVVTEGTACTMKHVGGAMELALRFEGIPDGAEAEITRVTVRSQDLVSSAMVRLNVDSGEDDDVIYYVGSAAYTLNVGDNSVVNYDGSDATTYSIPFNILPFSVDAESSITFDVYVSYTVDDVVTKLVKRVESVNTTDQPITFDRGTISHINKIVDMSDAEDADMLYLVDFSATEYPTDSDVWVIGDKEPTGTEFQNLVDAIMAIEASDSERKISLEFPCLKEIASTQFFEDNDVIVSISAESVTSIGGFAFKGCNSLTALKLGSEIEEIMGGAFNGCDNLTHLEFDSPNYILEDGVVYTSDNSTIVSALCAVVTGDFVSQSVTAIADEAFACCAELTSVNLPAVESIGVWAFHECDVLSAVSMPIVETIPNGAFANCGMLSEIECSEVLAIEDNAFNSCGMLSAIEFPKAQTIGSFAFFSCGVLEAVTFPNATTVGEYAFMSCSLLSQINLPAVISIESNAFINCSLKDLTIATDENTKLEYVDTRAFSWWQPTGGNDLYSISLTIGSANSEYIDDVTLSVGDFIGNFGRIIVVDGNGDVVSDSDDATDSDDSDIELISGGDFEDGESANVYAVGSATSEISADGGVDGSAALKVTNPEVQTDVWGAQIMIDVTAKKAFDATDKFIVSFDVRSDDGVTISDVFLQAPGYGSYYNGSINNSAFTATSSWTNISYELSASTISDASLFESSYIIALNFGYSAGTIYIDNVSVERVVD